MRLGGKNFRPDSMLLIPQNEDDDSHGSGRVGWFIFKFRSFVFIAGILTYSREVSNSEHQHAYHGNDAETNRGKKGRVLIRIEVVYMRISQNEAVDCADACHENQAGDQA